MAAYTFAPLTPTSFLARSATVFRDRVAVVDGDRTFTYAELHDRSLRLTGVLAGLGVGPGDRVAALCTNSHVMLEMHHGVPLRGAVLVPLNIRLSVDELTFIVGHSGATVLVATHELADTARQVAERCGARLVVAGDEQDEYGALLDAAEPQPEALADERDLLAINYTSGTTGSPKGVMYHHRGAFLQALAMAFHTRLTSDSRYLWTLPMFHCDGWCFPWAVTAAGGTHVCLRAVDPAEIWRLLRGEGVTHYSAAPTVLTMIANAPEADGDPLDHQVDVTTGGAPPSPDPAEPDGRAADAGHPPLRAHRDVRAGRGQRVALGVGRADRGGEGGAARRQGVGNVVAQPLRVIDLAGDDVPADGTTIGEIAARGNDVMLGYYRDEKATAAVDAGGWFRTGDLAVMHPDGYVEIRDRSKDIIISGGENIASVEVERAIDSHPDVVESAVVGRPDERWGEVPVAYVVLREGATADAAAIIAHVRERLASFKAPKAVVFGDLPKTSTGKIQKHVLRRSDVQSAPLPDGSGGEPGRAHVECTSERSSVQQPDGRLEHGGHVAGVEHHVLPGEADHRPAVDHERVVALAVALHQPPGAVELERLGLDDQTERAVDEVGAADAAHAHLRPHLQPGDVEGDRPEHRLERVVREAVRMLRHAEAARAVTHRHPLGGPEQPRPGQVAGAQRRVRDRQRLVEGQPGGAVHHRAHGVGGESVHLAGVEVEVEQPHRRTALGRDLPVARHRHRGDTGWCLTFQPWCRAALSRHRTPLSRLAARIASSAPGRAYRPRASRTTRPRASAVRTRERDVSRCRTPASATPPSRSRTRSTFTAPTLLHRAAASDRPSTATRTGTRPGPAGRVTLDSRPDPCRVHVRVAARFRRGRPARGRRAAGRPRRPRARWRPRSHRSGSRSSPAPRPHPRSSR